MIYSNSLVVVCPANSSPILLLILMLMLIILLILMLMFFNIRSRDDLQQQLGGCLPSKQFTGEDQWFSKEKLYKVRK